MATDSSKNNGHVAFSNDVEEGAPVATGPDLSQSEKAWDIDGDGKLDPTELALKDIDKTGKGTLSKDQMYHLMHQNLMVQKDLKKVKKFVIGLVVLTALLALANVGVSFAAAYLAKDTKTVEGKLVVSSSGETVQTDSSTKVFVVDTDLQERVRRERRLACTTDPGQGKAENANCDFRAAWGVFSAETGETIVESCRSGGTVAIQRKLQKTLNDGTIETREPTHTICQADHIDYYRVGTGNIPRSMAIHKNGVANAITVVYDGNSKMYTIDGLDGDEGDACSNDDGCVDDLVCSDEGFCKLPLGSECYTLDACSSNLKCEDEEGEPNECVRSEGHECDDNNPCGSDLACESNAPGEPNTCKGLYLHTCEVTDECSSQQGVTTLTCVNDVCVGTAALDQVCDDSNPCGTDLKCDDGSCKGDAGYDCSNPNGDACGNNLTCENKVCVGLQGASCDTNADCSSDHFCYFGNMLFATGRCECTFDGNSCGTDEVCVTGGGSCGAVLVDVAPGCVAMLSMTQSCEEAGFEYCRVDGTEDYSCEGALVKEGGSGDILCTEVAQECPDGSFVSPDPLNNCQIPPCPDSGCPKDAKLCGTDTDGSQVWVGRDPQNCSVFEACPEGFETKDTLK